VRLPLGREERSQEQSKQTSELVGGSLVQGRRPPAGSHWALDEEDETPLFCQIFFRATLI
jgi:hypothetical protein